ncbi:helix-turn-helix transcriptional regulator [Actinokineospora soli]|uniref:Helix-turn-helix transcriptional regulator n=1 Tax=Actinokineospora soli TaxID=1048753 RepID=A0ABW2TKU3_9PSEU
MKQRRLSAGFTLQEVADATGFHMSTLSRAETGVRSLSPEDTAALLAVYRVTGPDRTRILQLSRQAHQVDWWEPSPRTFGHMDTLSHLESMASHITHSAMLRIPGLLQTVDYTRVIMLNVGHDASTVRSRVEARLLRQKVLAKPNAPRYLAILDEMALRRVAGSPVVMAAQMTHMIQMAGRPNVDIRIIPFAHGSHVGLDSSYVVMRFPNSEPALYFEQFRSSLIVDGERTVAFYDGLTERLLQAAWSPVESVRFPPARRRV